MALFVTNEVYFTVVYSKSIKPSTLKPQKKKKNSPYLLESCENKSAKKENKRLEILVPAFTYNL